MKILLIPTDFHRHETNPELFTDMLNAFNKEHEAIIYKNFDQAVDFNPALIFFQGSLSWTELFRLKTDIETVYTQKPVVCMWTGDAPAFPPNDMIAFNELIDYYLLPFSGECLEKYETILGKPCYFIWEPIQNWRFKQATKMDDGDVVFVGNHYDHLPGNKPRENLFTFISERVPGIKLYGNIFGAVSTIEYTKTPELYNNAFLVICENNYCDKEDYFTPRNIGAMAAGSCALHKYFPGIEKHFQNFNHGCYYKDEYDLLALINFLRANPYYRNKAAAGGFTLASEKFSLDNWVTEFFFIFNAFL